MPSQTFTSSGSFAVPANALVVSVYAWGEGGNGGTSAHGSNAGAGGGGGAFGGEAALGGLTPGTTTLTITIGSGGTSTNTTVTGGSVTVQGNAGQNASGTTAGAGGTAGTNSIAFKGGTGATGSGGATQNGSGGGGSAGSTSAGGDASASTGGTAGTGAAGPPSLAGAAGANGAGSSSAGANGTAPGSGASGGGSGGSLNHTGGTGAAGQVVIVWTTVTISPTGYASVTGTAAAAKKATTSAQGYTAAAGAPLRIAVVNAWSGTFAQPAAFGTTPPALQSVVVPLTAATSVGSGTGVSSPGNWLFCAVGINESAATAGFTVGDADDIHSFWRPGDETNSNWAVSTGAALTRTSVWYTPNIARQVNDVYVAPTGACDAYSVLVLEVAGLGPWDTVTGIFTNYAAAATSLNLALSAPSASAFLLAAATGDLTTAGQALSPGVPWNTLPSVSVSNGTDHTCDCVLTCAYLPATSGSVSVNATASSATDLSGVIIGVLTSAPSPIPAGSNPAWPWLRFEAAFGGGFQTPQDSLTWTDLTTRLWAWNETTGIQYQLGDVQATDVEMELDNVDGNLSSDSGSSPYAGRILTGTPLRIRAALGTIGGQQVNRWYVIQRNLQEWPQQVDDAYRRYVAGTGTDIWSTLASSGPSPYRGEVEQDSPYAWWPCDDAPLAGGVLPTTLRNAAAGNSNVLNIVASPNGVTSQDMYSSNAASGAFGGGVGAAGTDLTALSNAASPSVATYSAGANQGWMFGDPQASPQSAQTGNPVTAQPGSASWQAANAQGNTGAHGWFLDCNDASFPDISAGITVEAWFNYQFAGSSNSANNGAGTYYNVAQQPWCPLTLLELATASAPVAVLQLDISGHLSLTTYNGGTGTAHSVYSTSDLRCGSWFQVTLTLTGSAYAVYVNGGLTATVTGSATTSPTAWTWLVVNGDLGTGGGSTLANIVHSGNVAVSHVAVYSSVLPLWRILARYCAAVTAFGLLPAPTGVACTVAENQNPTGFTPDGSEYQGSYGTGVTSFSFSAVAAAVAGSYSSGPSARAVTAGQGQGTPSAFSAAVWTGWIAVAPLVQVFTASSANSEKEAAAVLGAGDSFTSGFGSAASGHGAGQVAGGTNATPPASPSALGDTVAQRIERCLSYAGITPGRCIDPAALQVQAATDVGGQQAGANIANITQSDGGMLYIDNLGNLTYWQKSRLASQYSSPVWTIGPSATGNVIPYYREFRWVADPQRVWNAVTIQPFSPDGASLPLVTPSSASAVAASQKQYGAQPKQVISYLQSTTEMQSFANWLFSNFGQVEIRADRIRIDAAAYPAAWPLVLGVNVGDLVTVQNWQIGGGGTTGTFRVTEIRRRIVSGTHDTEPEASVELTCDFEPSSYWS